MQRKGHYASKCPKAKQLNSFTSRADAGSAPPATVFAWSLESSDEFLPAQRTVKRASATSSPKRAFTVNDEIESAFTKLARIEAMEQSDEGLDDEQIVINVPKSVTNWPRQAAAEECAKLSKELGRLVCPLVPENIHHRDCGSKKATSARAQARRREPR